MPQRFTEIFDCPACAASFLIEARRDAHAATCDGTVRRGVGAPKQLLERVRFNIENPDATPEEKRAARRARREAGLTDEQKAARAARRAARQAKNT
jgi:hypothetical protein